MPYGGIGLVCVCNMLQCVLVCRVSRLRESGNTYEGVTGHILVCVAERAVWVCL